MSGGGGFPPDNSVQVEQMQEASAQAAQERQDKIDAQNKSDLAAARGQAIDSGTSSAKNYFTQQGLDPNDYATQIANEINSLSSGIAPNDPNPGSYFKDAGALAYDAAQTGQRTQYGKAIDKFAPSNFEYTRIPGTEDDPILAAILGEKRNSADAIVQNMLNRGVITQSGYNADEQALDKQSPTVQSQLNEIGSLALENGRSSLRDVANRGRSAASTYTLGTSFDPYSYSSQIDSAFSDFINSLGTNIRGKAAAPLFDTSGLAAIAGAGSGAQNTKFDPNALAGIIAGNTDQNTTDSSDPNRQVTGTSVF